jgi:hypothetical protein
MTTDTTPAMDALNTAQGNVDKVQNLVTVANQPWSPEMVKFLTISILGFTCIALLMAAVLLWRSNASGDQVLKVFGVISILVFSALLLVVGYDLNQLTPIIGLFGAIAGYLLGKDTKT